MSTIVYFSKLNLQSHITEVLRDQLSLPEVLRVLHNRLIEDSNYIQENEYLDEEGEVKSIEIEYRIGNVLKNPEGIKGTIAGIMYKKHKLFHKVENEKGEIVKSAVDNIEAVSFFLDIEKERVAFFTANRFGYEQFNNALKGIINNVLSPFGYEFDVDTIVDPIGFDEIFDELSKIGRLSELKIDIKLPNPGDADIDLMVKNREEFIEKYADAGVGKKSVILKAPKNGNIVVHSELVKNEIDVVSEIHSLITPETAIANGYVEIEAKGSNSTFATKKNRPKKSVILDSQKLLRDFIVVASRLINTYF